MGHFSSSIRRKLFKIHDALLFSLYFEVSFRRTFVLSSWRLFYDKVQLNIAILKRLFCKCQNLYVILERRTLFFFEIVVCRKK